MSDFGSISEWEEAFQSLMSTSEDGYLTAEELGEKMNLGRAAVLRRLKALQRSGRLETDRKRTTDITGRPQNTPAYRIKES